MRSAVLECCQASRQLAPLASRHAWMELNLDGSWNEVLELANQVLTVLQCLRHRSLVAAFFRENVKSNVAICTHQFALNFAGGSRACV